MMQKFLVLLVLLIPALGAAQIDQSVARELLVVSGKMENLRHMGDSVIQHAENAAGDDQAAIEKLKPWHDDLRHAYRAKRFVDAAVSGLSAKLPADVADTVLSFWQSPAGQAVARAYKEAKEQSVKEQMAMGEKLLADRELKQFSTALVDAFDAARLEAKASRDFQRHMLAGQLSVTQPGKRITASAAEKMLPPEAPGTVEYFRDLLTTTTAYTFRDIDPETRQAYLEFMQSPAATGFRKIYTGALDRVQNQAAFEMGAIFARATTEQ